MKRQVDEVRPILTAAEEEAEAQMLAEALKVPPSANWSAPAAQTVAKTPPYMLPAYYRRRRGSC